MTPDPACTTCGHTGDDRRYYSYESWSVGTKFACDACIEAHMTCQPELQLISNTEAQTKGR